MIKQYFENQVAGGKHLKGKVKAFVLTPVHLLSGSFIFTELQMKLNCVGQPRDSGELSNSPVNTQWHTAQGLRRLPESF